MLNHVLLEVFCTKNWEQNVQEPMPAFCAGNGACASYTCLANRCKYLDFTSCEDTLCYIGNKSDMDYGILFGGDMEEGNPSMGVEQWREIAIAKIDEAYDTFMEKSKKPLEEVKL